MRLLVTGGAGYVGSHVVRALQEAGHEAVVYDNLSTGHFEAVRQAELVVGDVGDKECLAKTLRQRSFDGAIHLAASSLVGESVKNPSKYFRNNLANALVLLDALVEADVPSIVVSSTAAIYGEPQTLPIPEDHVQQPTSPYGESKRMLEQVLDWYERAYGLRSSCLRYFNAAGAHPAGDIGEDHSPETHLIPLVLQVALGQRESLSVFGNDYPTHDGSAIRDYVHVCDLASAHVAVGINLCQGGPSVRYNLGSQRGYSVLEVIEAARQVTGAAIPVVMSERRAGDPAVLTADTTRIRLELGWTPKHSLTDMIATAWQWHRYHPNGYSFCK